MNLTNRMQEILVRKANLSIEKSKIITNAIESRVNAPLLSNFANKWHDFDNKTQNEIAATLFGRYNLSHGLLILESLNDMHKKDKVVEDIHKILYDEEYQKKVHRTQREAS